ncbi:MAG TPA: DUF4365 domain-containing protein [Gemmataceae bacterium]|nr:DUF4365 domain-containing protein [Gemmataceae bacterium]
MPSNPSGPRKQRTRQHIIADQSLNYVQRFIIDEGHTSQELTRDYGYDLVMFTYDERGYIEPDFVAIQIKATERLHPSGSVFVYDLDIRDYNLWMLEKVPVILVLYDAADRRAVWVEIHEYFSADGGRRPKKGARTIRIRVPMNQSLNRRAIAKMRALKPARNIKLMETHHDD